jgi:hypothetical protein
MDELQQAIDVKCRAAAEEVDRIVGDAREPEAAENQVEAVDVRSLPSFFIVGPPRTGSSWLHEVLSSYALLPSPSKETRFFDTHFHRGLRWYVAHYAKPEERRRIGEVAPTYFASAAARERIAQTVPEAKIVCVFRNPVDRIVSLYRLKRAYGLIPWGFEEAIERDPELMESSKYATTLRLWQRSFGTRNIFAGLYDDLRENPQAFVDEVADFIGVPRFALLEWQYGFVHDSERMTHPRNYYGTRTATRMADWFKARRMDRLVSAFKRSRLRNLVLGGGPPFPKVPAELLTKLNDKFLPEVEQLETMLGRDLTAWKSPKAA